MSERIHLSDGTSWPRPAVESDYISGLGWRLTYQEPTRADILEAVAIIQAYGYLTVDATRAKRDLVAREIRASLNAERST